MHTMKRRDFLRVAALLGLAGPVAAACAGSDSETGASSERGFDGTVLVIGAGAAGLSAGHLLRQRGVDFQILEAGASHGGRIRRTLDFVDFPIPLGGEWLHVGPGELAKIVNDASVDVATQVAGYAASDLIGTYDGELTIETSDTIDADLKFIGSSWLDFFDEYVVPSVEGALTLNTAITRVDHRGDRVVVTDAEGDRYEADAVVVTVPIQILIDGDIEFEPPLPSRKLDALGTARVWGGMKVFIEFSEKFYPTFLEFPDSYTDTGQRLWYDAAYGQNSAAHVCGLFSVGEQALPYQERTGDDLLAHVLGELDDIFDGAASRTYVQHIAQNWSAEPFIRQAYLADNARSSTSRVLSETIDNRVFFAGDAYTREDDWSAVHNAARSARDVVAELLR